MRSKGAGSVFYDPRRGRCLATLEAGWTKRGTRRRVTRVAKSELEARQILAKLLREGAPLEGTTTTTVKSYIDKWLPRQADHLRPSAFMVTRSAANSWIVPAIGHRRLDKLNRATSGPSAR